MKKNNLKKCLFMLSVLSSPLVVSNLIDGNIASANQNVYKSGWIKDYQGRWYFYENGRLAINKWIGNYYLGSNGIMLTNTWTPDGYYVDENGKWVKGAVKPQSKKIVKNGWIKTNQGQWYYYDNGKMVVSRWIGNYYLGSNGVMLTNTWTPDGYYVDKSGKWMKNTVKSNKTSDFKVKVNNNDKLVYYTQNNRLYANKRYGAWSMAVSGCVPTSIAMISSTLGNNVSPVEIADYLYNNTNTFNKKEIGTSSNGVLAALSRYGLKYKPIYSNDEMNQELSKGNIVYMAVDGIPFINPGYSHAIVLRGYDSLGRATVYNPHSSYGIRKYNTSVVWNKKSVDRTNYLSGTPAIVVYK